jgi:hypothetical protein
MSSSTDPGSKLFGSRPLGSELRQTPWEFQPHAFRLIAQSPNHAAIRGCKNLSRSTRNEEL